jgi:hypothetical protein
MPRPSEVSRESFAHGYDALYGGDPGFLQAQIAFLKKSRIWLMRQQFEVEEARERSVFEVVHRLRVRTMDEYAQAVEDAGFTVLEALTAYPTGNVPHTPETLRHDRRLILVARRQVAQPGKRDERGRKAQHLSDPQASGER